MNDKKAKQLRRMARNATVGMPERRLVWGEVSTRRGMRARGRAVNDPESTRGLYRRLKRDARKAVPL